VVFQVSVSLKIALMFFSSFAATYIDRDVIDVEGQQQPFVLVLCLLIGSVLLAMVATVTKWVVSVVSSWYRQRHHIEDRRANFEVALVCRIAMQQLVMMREKQFLASIGRCFDYERRTFDAAFRGMLALFFQCQPGRRLHDSMIVRGAGTYAVHDHCVASKDVLRSMRSGELPQKLERDHQRMRTMGRLSEHLEISDGKRGDFMNADVIRQEFSGKFEMSEEEFLEVHAAIGLQNYSIRQIKSLMDVMNNMSSSFKEEQLPETDVEPEASEASGNNGLSGGGSGSIEVDV